jgi:ubiquinone/menaquinone biosynthesis C-methylase UbiE
MADFTPIASALRSEVQAFFERTGKPLEGPAGHNTLETNSGFVERRGRPLLQMLGFGDGVEGRPLEGLDLLDVGCGFGALALLFAVHGARVTGVDPDDRRFPVGRTVAERFDLPVRFVRGRMEAIPLPDDAFDLAVVNNSLCYVVDLPARVRALAEVRRVLRPGGRVVVRNPNRWHPLDVFTGLPLVHMLPRGLAAPAAERLGRTRSDTLLVSPPRARRELREAGFVDVRQHGFADSARPDALKPIARYQHFTARAA